MGTSFSNIQVRAENADAVAQTLQKVLKAPAYVSGAHGGWVSVFPDTTAYGEESIAKQLSRRLPAAVFVLLVHDSDIFAYTLYEAGKKMDEYDSSPDYFEKATKARRERVRGRSELVLPFCVAGTTLANVEAVLHSARVPMPDGTALPDALNSMSEAFEQWAALLGVSRNTLMQQTLSQMQQPLAMAEDRAAAFAALLGINESLAYASFADVSDEDLAEEYEADEFCLVEPIALSQAYLDQKLRDALGVRRDYEAAREWIRKGADVNTIGANLPLLVYQVQHCIPETIAFLLEMGANPNAATTETYPFGLEKGVTALMMVVFNIQYPNKLKRLETLRLLLNAGADINAVSEIGRTALKQAQGFFNQEEPEWLARVRPHLRPDQEAQVAEQSAAVVQLLRAAGAKEQHFRVE